MPNVPVTWRDAQIVNSVEGGAQNTPRIIQLSNGNILVVWTSDEDSGAGGPVGTDIIGRIFDPLGNAVGGEFRINSGSTADNEQAPSIVATAGGGFIIVYHDVDLGGSNGSNIRLEEYDAFCDLLPGNPVVVSDSGHEAAPNFAAPAVAVAGLTALIVYEEHSAGGSNVVGRFYSPVTNLYGLQFDLFSGNGTSDPQLIALANGNFVVAASQGGADPSIVYRVYSALGLPLTGTLTVQGTATDTLADSQPSLVALTGGGFVIAWTAKSGGDSDIAYRTFTSGGTQFGAGEAGSDGASNTSSAPSLTALANGGFAIVFQNGTTGGLEASHIAANGTMLGNFAFASGAAEAAAIGLGDGRMAVVSTTIAGGNIALEFLDTRDVINPGSILTPAGWMIGTVFDEVVTGDGVATVLHGWDGGDILTQGLGIASSLYGDAGDDTIVARTIIDLDRFEGGDGIDTIDWSGALLEIGATFNMAAGTATSLLGLSEVMLGFERLIGTPNADTIIGTAAADTLSGGGGNDYIVGQDGNDILSGDSGLNTLQGGFGDDVYIVTQTREDTTTELAGQGNDEVRTTFSVYALQDHIERLTFIDNAQHGAGVGNDLDNVIAGGLGVDDLFGRAGNDVLRGNAGAANTLLGQEGDDRYIVEAIGDTVIESAGEGTDTVETALSSFVLRDHVENLVYTGIGSFTGVGASEDNSISGGAGDDFLSGLDGNDVLTGGSGSDLMIGGEGSDMFHYQGGEAGVDRILGFVSGEDRIALSSTGFTHSGAFAVVNGNAATSSLSTFLYDASTGMVRYDADGNGGGAAIQIAQLDAGLTLSAGDFTFY